MEKEISTHRREAKSAKSHEVTSTDCIRYENPCKRSETANSPTQPASTGETHQEKALETYPWMKEFRSKGMKQNSTFCMCVLKTYAGQLVAVSRLQPLRFLLTFLQQYFQNRKTNFFNIKE